jgi:hypothetical protein
MRRAGSTGEPSAPSELAGLWRAFELAQRHYETELQLFSVRMNLFLLIQSALVALFGSVSKADQGVVAVFGLLLAMGWGLVAGSSYLWVKTWRAQWIVLGDSLHARTNIEVPSRFFDRKNRQNVYERAYSKQRFWKKYESFSWKVRPTVVTCCMPALFIVGWIALLITAFA